MVIVERAAGGVGETRCKLQAKKNKADTRYSSSESSQSVSVVMEANLPVPVVVLPPGRQPGCYTS